MPLLEQDALARRVARAVGALGDELHVERLRLGLADLVLERAGREDVGLGAEELFARDGLAAGVAGDAAVGFDVVLQLVGVEALGVVHVPGVVADGDRRHAELREDDGGVRADVAEALHDHRRAVEVEALLLGPLEDAEDDALAGGLLRGRACRRWRPACR